MAETNDSKQRLLSALKDYVNLGLPIIPLCSHDHVGYSERHIARCNQAGKVPLTKGWQTHETTTIAQIQTWLREFKNINIGLPLGHISGYIGIDVDGVLGEDMLEEMSNGDLPATWEFSTGDGRRLLYQIPVGLQTKKFVNANKDEEHTECSILAFGQQTVMPPSVHYSGRVYEWVQGRSPEDLDCSLAPKWLVDLVKVDTAGSRPGTIDLNSSNPSFTPATKVKGKEISPIIVTDDMLPAEFSSYENIALDLTIPDSSYTGKAAKEQQEKDNGIGPEELTQKITAGGRDNQMTRIIGHFCAKFRALGKDYILLMAHNHNQTFCDPPLDQMAIEAKVNHFWESEQLKSAQYRNQKANGDDKVQFEPLRIAQVVWNTLEDEGKVLKADIEEPVLWITSRSEGPWKSYYAGGAAEGIQLFLLKALTETELGGDPRWAQRKYFGEVANALLLLLRQAGKVWTASTLETNTQSITNHKYIPLKGGKLLEWRTGKLLPWDPETHLTYVLPVEYDPNAKCPNWEMRLEQWLPEQGVRNIIQEFIGYSFIPYMGFEKALLIQGEGANGKSLFLETLQQMLGRDVTTSATMSFLFSRFGKKPLLGKILNIVNEAGADYLRGANADDFKNMVSGGTVIADIKNKEPISFNNTAKFIFSANHDIKTSDKSDAWGRRILLIPFDKSFKNSTESKTDIMDAMAKEYAGIFNWAVEGLKRLVDQKGFSQSDVVDAKMRDYTNSNDIAADFFNNCMVGPRPELTIDGEPIEKGVACSTVVDLFRLYTAYKGTELKKHNERIRDYMEKKKKIKQARKPKSMLYLSDAVKTSCWVHANIHITDPDFLEWIVENELLSLSNMPLKMYISKRLDEINEDPSPNPPTVASLPNSKAQ